MVSELSVQDIQERFSSRRGKPVPIHVAKCLWKQTFGLNWLVEHLLVAQGDGDSPGTLLDVEGVSVLQDVALELSGLDTKLQTLVLAMGLGFDVREQVPDVLADEDLEGLIAHARSEGLITESETVPPLLRRALLLGNRPALVKSLQLELVQALTDRGPLSVEAARSFATDGFRDRRVARVLESAGDENLVVDPALAITLYEEAETAGLAEWSTASRRAEAAYSLGNLDQAARLVDGLLALPEAPDLLRGAEVGTAVWAARGMMGRSAALYKWLGIERTGPATPAASVVLTGTGDIETARMMLDSTSTHAAPTLLAEASKLMGQGIQESLTGHPHQVLALLIRASDMLTSSGSVPPMAETPAVLAALVAIHGGELETAGTVIRSALASGQGGPAHRPRLLLMSAWVAMQQDDPEEARAAMLNAQPAGTALTPRDQFLRSALEVGLARRAGDAGLLIQSWQHAREALLHVSVDLYSLLPWGELMVAAARLRQSATIEPYIAEGWALLGKLGNPPLWSIPFHWSAVGAALLADRPSAMAPHAAALVRASDHSHVAAVLAEAGRTWVSVLAGHFSVESVEKAARGLASLGMKWEGSRLAGHAAPRAGDRKDMARLLACARDLDSHAPWRADTGQPVVSQAFPETTAIRVRNDRTRLSVREREVARMVLDGKTYREIGESLFISPRTAEHHMLRIRRRLETTSRSDTLTKLRLLLDPLEAGKSEPNP
ncbi:LuxR C-terminal-related transcriptional regulator [Arthrobacter sp. ISL-95]|uniref:LuxR C-terminal-related transcriptional regulator n=1 Tax=Arthrobacter sp. ISL-95 TaxID=2819116 RepID=UPI001BE51E80|nr:LuxR C-terminal-related transcriptional regulator [Arthrobacter sp. ISL-95]MBT2587058.1 helix-turn-helix transcriptional regulator [Arthrobacter sp. ISL-95]